MRVSDSMMQDLVSRGVGTARQEMFEAQRVASTGMRVEKPSDDPVAASRARGSASRERRADAVARTSDAAIDRLQAVDGVLDSVGGVLSRARELAVLGANDHVSPEDRVALATEVSSLRLQLLNLSNTQIEGEFVFGGRAVDREPFDVMGAYQGDTGLVEIDVGAGLRVPTQVAGPAVFGTGGGVDAFATLDALESALSANDGAAVHALLDDLGSTVDQVANARTTVGGLQQSLQQARAAAERTRDEAIRSRAAMVEADPIEAFSDLMRAESALREAIAIAGRMPPPSLVQGGG